MADPKAVESMNRAIFECPTSPPPPLPAHVKGPASDESAVTCSCKWGFTVPVASKKLSEEQLAPLLQAVWSRHLSAVQADRADWDNAQGSIKTLGSAPEDKVRCALAEIASPFQKLEAGLSLWKEFLSVIAQWQQEYPVQATANLRPSILEMQRIQEFLPGTEGDAKLRDATRNNRHVPIRISSSDTAATIIAAVETGKGRHEGVPMVAALAALRSLAAKSTSSRGISGDSTKEELAAVRKAHMVINVGVNDQSVKSLESALGECEVLRERLDRVLQLPDLPNALATDAKEWRNKCEVSADSFEEDIYRLWEEDDGEAGDKRSAAIALQSGLKAISAAAAAGPDSEEQPKKRTTPKRKQKKPAALRDDDDDEDEDIDDDDDEDEAPRPVSRRRAKKKAAPAAPPMSQSRAKPSTAHGYPAMSRDQIRAGAQMPAARTAHGREVAAPQAPVAYQQGHPAVAAQQADEPYPPLSPFFPRGIVFSRGVTAPLFHHLAGFAWLFSVIFKHSSVTAENPLRSGLEDSLRPWRFDLNNAEEIARIVHSTEAPAGPPVVRPNGLPFQHLRGKPELDEVVTELIRRLPIALLQSVYDLLSNPSLGPFFSHWDPIVQEYAEYLHVRLWSEVRFLQIPCCHVYKPAEVEFAASLIQQGVIADTCFALYQNQRPFRVVSFACQGDLRHREAGARQCQACEQLSRMLYQISANNR